MNKLLKSFWQGVLLLWKLLDMHHLPFWKDKIDDVGIMVFYHFRRE